MGYKFTCESCDFENEVGFMGNYPLTWWTDNPCPKCGNKTIVAHKQEVKEIQLNNKAPRVIYGNPKSCSGDFKNFVSAIKKVHKGSTIEI